jgi:hypothetical protein
MGPRGLDRPSFSACRFRKESLTAEIGRKAACQVFLVDVNRRLVSQTDATAPQRSDPELKSPTSPAHAPTFAIRHLVGCDLEKEGLVAGPSIPHPVSAPEPFRFGNFQLPAALVIPPNVRGHVGTTE